jgi:hypothetical protein
MHEGLHAAAPLPPPAPGRVLQAPQRYACDVEGESVAGARARAARPRGGAWPALRAASDNRAASRHFGRAPPAPQ